MRERTWEVAEGSAPGVTGSSFPSLEVCTTIVINNSNNVRWSNSPPRWRLCSLLLFLFLPAGAQIFVGQPCPVNYSTLGYLWSSPVVLSGGSLKRWQRNLAQPSKFLLFKPLPLQCSSICSQTIKTMLSNKSSSSVQLG